VDGTRSALIIASDQYSDPGLRRLRAPAADAQALASVLREPEIGGFEVRTLLNEPAHEVNLAVEEFFAERRADDLLLMHFSCHGVKDEDGELYFAMTNTRLRRLAATAVAAEFVNRRMGRSRSRRVVLLLDCCYAGAFERGMTARAGPEMGIEQQFSGRGRAVITASSAMEYAFENDDLADTRELAPSVFTSALVQGLETGEADRDQDGLIALDELYEYVYDKVRAATPNQTPGKWTFGVQGELVIARRRRPVATPAPLPPALQDAIDSPLAAVRVGAVQELTSLLRGRHAGLALAARLALERLSENDSRAVAAAASAALGVQAKPSALPEPAPPEPGRPPLPGPGAAATGHPERGARGRLSGAGSHNTAVDGPRNRSEHNRRDDRGLVCPPPVRGRLHGSPGPLLPPPAGCGRAGDRRRGADGCRLVPVLPVQLLPRGAHRRPVRHPGVAHHHHGRRLPHRGRLHIQAQRRATDRPRAADRRGRRRDLSTGVLCW
jgi:Caspase domain